MFYDWFKRLTDFFGAFLLLILFSPVIFVTCIAIKLTSSGPVFADTPKRVGKGGKLFYPYKFRSMVENAHKLMQTDPKFKKLYKKYQKGSFKSPEDDPRITRVGSVIRRYSVDEVPQFLNVLKREMSIVGPRQYYPDELAFQQKRYPTTRELVTETLKVKPGITGFWQVSGRSEINFDKRIEMDAYYARKRSALLDVLILLKTPFAMISGKGAV